MPPTVALAHPGWCRSEHRAEPPEAMQHRSASISLHTAHEAALTVRRVAFAGDPSTPLTIELAVHDLAYPGGATVLLGVDDLEALVSAVVRLGRLQP